ncbi:hypothetical protein D3C85_1503260 [compost metagenome]
MVHIIAKSGDVFGGQIDNRRQRLQQRGHIVDFAGDNLDLIQRNVTHQRNAVAVENQPATGGNRHHLDVVLIGSRLVERMLFYLQAVQVEDQHAKTGNNQHHCHAGAAYKQHFFGGMVANFIF